MNLQQHFCVIRVMQHVLRISEGLYTHVQQKRNYKFSNRLKNSKFRTDA